MRKSLTFKMFLTLFTSFVLLILVIMLFLFLYFEFSFKDSKINRTIRNINEFAESYMNAELTEQELYQQISNFNNNNNVSMSMMVADEMFITGNYGPVGSLSTPYIGSLESSYQVTVAIDDRYYDMFLNETDYSEIIESSNIKIGDSIFITGYIDQFYTILPNLINNQVLTGAEDYLSDINTSFFTAFNQTAVYITSSRFMNYNITDIGESLPVNNLNVRLSPLIGVNGGVGIELEAFEKDGVSYLLSEIPYTYYEQVSLFKTFQKNGKEIALFAEMSLQSVGEVMEIMTMYLPYFLIGALLLAFIISLVYSKTVSKPIVSITKIADQMANMNLEAKSTFTSRDELGRLSTSLNTLSSNLKEAMAELVEKNEQLLLDYEKEKMQEESRKTFIANASHELKTPLGVIKSYTEAIRDGVREEKNEYYMDVILDEITHMDHLIIEMIQLSKFDGGAAKYEKEDINLDTITKNVTDYLKAEAEKRNLTIIVSFPLGEIYGDRKKIHQVILNLLSNAVKYADDGSSIKIESFEKNDITEFKIYNQCPSFSKVDLDMIWDRFYKVDSSHNRDIEGSGLGLAIVKSILDAHEAEYGVYNTSNGICFYFSLPQF